MGTLKERLIVALDVDSAERALQLVTLLSAEVRHFKIGAQLFTACGPEVMRHIAQRGGSVFLDLKFHDIPQTVASAVRAARAHPGMFMLTVHAAGGLEMMREAARAAAEDTSGTSRPKVVAVTRLTSDPETPATAGEVLQRAKTAKEAGLDGVVCSAHETAALRKQFGSDFIIVNPGIRPKGYKADDQKRVATAREALEAGASYIVVGRPVIGATDPLAAVRQLL